MLIIRLVIIILLKKSGFMYKNIVSELCSKLSEGGIISPVAFLDIFSAPRKQYQLGFSKLMEAVVDMVNKDPNTAVTPVQTPVCISAIMWLGCTHFSLSRNKFSSSSVSHFVHFVIKTKINVQTYISLSFLLN